jgi:dTDP-4-amino-4,6-dideoxygalactose transaminase
LRPITLAPLPKWRDLFAATFNFAAPDDALAAPWYRAGESAFWFSHSACSLAVVARWRRQLLGKPDLTVWIPAFFCNASLAPLRAMGAKLVFYPVTEQMSPDLTACQDLSGQQPLDLFVLAHYFGRPSSDESIALLCKKHGAWLVEDAAHVLRPIAGVGETGDCILYSPHKHLPIPDGAVLVVRPNGPARLAENELAMNVLSAVKASMLATPGSSMQPAIFWLLKRLAQRMGLRARRTVIVFRQMIEPNVAVLAHPRMSALARRLLSPLLPQLEAVAAHREQNALTWINILACANTAAKAISDGMTVTPYLADFSAYNATSAETLFDRLHQAGLPVTTWPDLPPEVLANAATHPHATALRENRVYLPVHQTLSQRQLIACGKSLLDMAAGQWQARVLTHDEWETYWQRCRQTNLLQSWQYGHAKEQAEGWKAKRFLILDQDGQAIALAQVLTRVLPFVGGIARLNRGPLLLADHPADAEVPLKLASLQVLLKEARRQRWWLLQAAPELLDCELTRYGLRCLGLESLRLDPWASGFLDLNLSENDLHGKLNRRWKRALRKASDCGVIIENEKLTTSRLADVLNSYKILQKENDFSGIAESLIEQLFAVQSKGWTINLFVAKIQNEGGLLEDVGYRLCIHHGSTALDFLVSTNEKGRQTEANSALYWHSILHAKQTGCNCFDIGGLSESTPKGIADFKQGMNAKPYKLVGEWRKWY